MSKLQTIQGRAMLERLNPYHPGKQAPDTVKLSSNENPLGPSPAAVAAYRDIAETLHRYPDGAAGALCSALAQYHDLAPEQFIIGNGSDEIMTLIAAAYLNPGETVLTAAETFSQYRFATTLYDGLVTEYPLLKGHYDLESMSSAFNPGSPAPKIVFLCNPNNPTGTFRTHDDIRAFIEQVPGDTLVILDEAYAEYAYSPDFPRYKELMAMFPNLMVLRTFSKLYGLAGLRVGYGMGEPELIQKLLCVKQPFNVSLAAQAAAVAALQDSSFRERSVQLNNEGRLWYEQQLQQLGLEYFPTQSNFLCINVGAPAAEAVRMLEGHGVSVRSLASFGLLQFIRVTIGRPEDNQKVVNGLRELSEVHGLRA
ncbi:MAG: histidinol-phosphate transaminase [Spirochaetaceae bacterium]|nr:MAG: histidinol-phosphate transaminase [Spirochaetaceae bacterium]